MPSLSFIYPKALWLLLLLIPIWGIALSIPQRLAPWRFWSSLLLRTTICLALILGLAGTQTVHPVDALTTVFLLDSSDSISPSARGGAEIFIQKALNHMHKDDQAGIVVFGDNALVERTPSHSTVLGQITSLPNAHQTDIQKAIELGIALFPAETQKRLVLLTDGKENTGHAIQAARIAAARHIPIGIVDLSGPTAGDEALIAHLDIPTHARAGQQLQIVITIESTIEQQAQLYVFADQNIIADGQISLAKGVNRFPLKATVPEQGFHRFRARIEPEHDVRIQNNEIAALVQVQGMPRIALVAQEPNEAQNLHNALTAAHIQTTIIDPANIPTDLANLSSYEAVALINVPARALPPETMPALSTYVHNLGRGLIMIGGTKSFGVGGYGRTPIEDALPVYMDVRDRQERPNLAIVFVIDKSGSMDACHCDGPNGTTGQMQSGGDRKLDIAKEAVTQASALLGPQDTLGIIAFDKAAYQVLAPTRNPLPSDVADAISIVEPIGNTNVGAGLLAAEEMLQTIDARIKHIVLLTDGWGHGGSNVPIAERMHENSITLSVIAAGNGSDNDSLQQLAIAGDGRFYAAEDIYEVPQIFIQETITAAGNYIVEGAFHPAIAADSTVLYGIKTSLPTLYGYNGTTIKETSRAILVSNDNSPILAEWNYGLGRSIAWTSDMKGQWGHDLVQWDKFATFAAQIVDWVLPTTTNASITTNVHTEGTQTTIVATIQDEAANPRTNLQLTAMLIESNPTEEPEASTSPQQIELIQVAPGEYRATFPSPHTGTYLVQLAGRTNEHVIVQETVGLVVPYSSEYSQSHGNPTLLADIAHLTDGQQIHTPEAAFTHNLRNVVRAQEIALPFIILALLLLPLDIAIRRLILHQRDIANATTWMRARLSFQRRTATVPDNATLERLIQAKQRAVERTGISAGKTDNEPPSQPNPPTDTTTPKAPSRTPPPAPTPTLSPEASLERLREAKERARRRARGEE